MTYDDLIHTLKQLPTGTTYPYLPSSTSSEQKSYKLISVNDDSIRVERDGDVISISIQQIQTLLQALRKDIPLDVEKTLGSSGNARSIIEALLCLTPTIFYTRISKRKHIYDSSSKTHALGIIEEIPEDEINKTSSNSDKLNATNSYYSRYITSLLAKHFVILTGNSGTGKTRISITVAKSLEQKVKTVQTNLAGYLRQYINKEINGVRVHSVSEYSVEVYNTKDKLICISLGIIQEYIDYYLKNGITSNPERANMQSNGNYDGQSYSWDTTHIEKIAKFMVDIVKQGPFYQEITNMLLVPVGADWTDNTKILGFYNPISHEYQSTQILDFIITARQNENIPFFLILDEMNLSHVERYFSDFLSAMESGEEIPLYKPDKQTKENIPQCIVLPKNLFVTGTVNIDETTYMFSPKVLDRANVIEFKPEMDDVLNLLDSASQFPSIGDSALTPEGFLKLANDISVADPANYNSVDFTDAKKIFETFYIKLEGSGFEFAYRTVKEIRNYIIASYELNSTAFNLNAVLDEQLLQKILPKIHGNTRQIKNLLIDLEKLCIEKDTECEFKDGDNQTEKVTGTGWNFELSRNKIHQMRRMLDSLNFASFI